MRPSSTDVVLRIEAMDGHAGLVHGFSTLALGSMRGPSPHGPVLTPERRSFAAVLDLDPACLSAVGAVHGTDLARVDAPSGAVPGRDALVTDRPGLPLLATFADCCPVLLFDPVRRALGLAHAGWRGTAGGIARRAVEALGREYGSRPGDLMAGLGPAIC